MEDVARIALEFPIAREVRGRPGLGQLVDGYAVFDYPNVDIVDTRVFIRYGRCWFVEEKKLDRIKRPRKWADYEKQKKSKHPFGMKWTGEGVLRIYPLQYFYK